jgi:hypothetical protein
VGADAKCSPLVGKRLATAAGSGLVLDADHAADVVFDGLRSRDAQFAGEVVADWG